MYFANKYHEERFNKFLAANSRKNSNQFLIAVYLLSSDADIWKRARKNIGKNAINWSGIDLRGISMIGYGVFQLARDFTFGSVHCTLRNLCDTQMIPVQLSELAIEGIRIGREGYYRVCPNKVFN